MMRIYSKMGIFKKKKSKNEEPKADTKKHNPKELYTISSDMVKIRVYATFGGNVNQLKVEFTADERKNEGGGTVFENEKFKFNKDVDFEKADVYKSIELNLSLDSKTREKKIEILEKKIEYQKKLVKYLERFKKLNAIKNHADESILLHDYDILLQQIKRNEGEGAFFTIEEGMRVYSFVKEDGEYIPIWHSKNNKSQSPNNVTNNRTFILENKIFDMEMGERLKQKLQISSITVLLIVLVILIVANFTFTGFLINKNNDMNEAIHGASLKCAEETSKTNQNMVNFINNECVSKLIDEKEEEIKEENTSPDAIIPLTK